MRSFIECYRIFLLYAACSTLIILLLVYAGALVKKLLCHGKIKHIRRVLFRPTLSALITWLCVMPLVFVLIVRGSVKSEVISCKSPSSLAVLRRMQAPILSDRVSSEDIERGYRAGARVESELPVEMPWGAVTNEQLSIRGGHDWAFRVERDDWRFPWGDGTITGVTVIARGEVRPSIDAKSFPMPITNGVSLLPKAYWGLLPSGEASVFCHAVTSKGSLILDWRNALVGRHYNTVTNFQMELYREGSFVWRTPNGSQYYLPVLPFDWDGDGLENSVDPEPLSKNLIDAHGTNDEWARIVCSNVFETVDESIKWRSDVNTNAYYFVNVISDCGPAPIRFIADRDSRLGSPAIVARGGVSNRVPLLVGVEYTVTSTVPFTVSAPQDSFADVQTLGHQHVKIRWPLDFEFEENITEQGRSYLVTALPYDPGGIFSWTNSQDSVSSCSCFSGHGNLLSSSCSDACRCSGICKAGGYYALESAVSPFVGGTCRCGMDDPIYPANHNLESTNAPSFTVGFDKPVILFEDAYLGAPGGERRSTRAVLTISAFGGSNGGRLMMTATHIDKIASVGGSQIVLPLSREISPGETFFKAYIFDGVDASEFANDVRVAGVFTENNTHLTTVSETSLTVVRLELEATIDPPDDNYAVRNRHTYGVRELVKLRQTPTMPHVSWNPVGGGSNETDGVGMFYRCPLAGCADPLRAECDGVHYAPRLLVVEPSSVKAKLLFGASRSSVLTYSVAKGSAGGIGMLLRLYALPFTVSFTGIKIEEVPELTYEASGYFSNPYYNGAFSHTSSTGAGRWLEVAEDNSFAIDEASFTEHIPWLTPNGRITTDSEWSWTRGYVYIDNPFGWGECDCKNGDPPFKMFATDTKDEYMLDAAGTVGVRKLFNQVTRTTNDVIRLNGKLIR